MHSLRKVLITGNKGFVARNLIRYLESQQVQCCGFDQNEDFTPLKSQHYDAIFHLAAIARTAECTEAPFGKAHDSNIGLTCTILSDFSFDRIVYTSSCAIYGDQPTLPITEESLPNPPSVYAAQKFMSERYVHFTRQHARQPSVCLRLFNVYGETQSKDGSYPNVIASFLRSLKTKGYIEVTGDGTQSRDFVFVDDVVDALVRSASISNGNHVFNVSTGVQTPIITIARMLSDNITFVPPRPFDIQHQVADSSKIESALRWKSMIDITTGINRIKKYEGLL
jgi:UDP-glucose 4-epimerase